MIIRSEVRLVEQFILEWTQRMCVQIYLFWTILPLSVNRIFQFGQIDPDFGLDLGMKTCPI